MGWGHVRTIVRPLKRSNHVRSVSVEVIEGQKLLQRIRRIQVIPNSAPADDNKDVATSDSEIASIQVMREPVKLMTSKILIQYRDLKKEYPGYIILMQVGEFFEIFDEDAEKVSRSLDIGLCNNRYKTQMTGFPLRNMESYLERLVKAGLPAVIVEQIETGKMIKRRVTRIVTQGTLTEDGILESDSNNFMLAIETGPKDDAMGLAWIDLSTGYFRVLEINKDDLHSELQRISPAEIVVDETLKSDGTILKYMRFGRSVFSNINMHPNTSVMMDFFGEEAEKSNFSDLEMNAAARLLQYVLETQIGKRPYIEFPLRHSKKSLMHLDTSAVRALEILKNNSTNSRENSLLDILDESCTAAGSRLLVQRLTAPLLEIHEIEQRLDQVQFFVENPELTDDLRGELRNCRDLERSFQRLALGRNSGGPRDMLVIRQTLESAGQLKRLIDRNYSEGTLVSSNIDECLELTQELKRALVDSPPSRTTDGGLIRTGYSSALDGLTYGAESLEARRDAIVMMYRQGTGKNSLKLSSRKTLGLLVEVNKSEGPIKDPKFILDSVIGDKYRYRTTELETLNTRFTSSDEEALREEIKIYEGLRQKIVISGKQIMTTAKMISELDVTTALATRARKRGYVRPIITRGNEFVIEQGGHPIVEERHIDNGRSFVYNNCDLSERSRFTLITGPNMGGKSTFLRQNAIIAIMAQCGMFVPANKAVIGIIDAIYTRIGANDDLSRDKSTFMVEMTETANILRHVTPLSLVIMDEIGRGTSANEGFALAQGICQFLHKKGCRTLFATHYTQLGTLLERMPNTQCLMTNAEFIDGDLCFLHQILPGVAKKSHALHVAKLAGIPEEVLKFSASDDNL